MLMVRQSQSIHTISRIMICKYSCTRNIFRFNLEDVLLNSLSYSMLVQQYFTITDTSIYIEQASAPSESLGYFVRK